MILPALLILRQRSKHFRYNFDVVGNLHVAPRLKISYVLLKASFLLIVMAMPIGGGEAPIGPLHQSPLFATAHNTKFYYNPFDCPNHSTPIQIPAAGILR
jgi:hypothetical protein